MGCIEKWSLKYRPRTLDQILGQSYTKDLIRGALTLNPKPDVWLFTGSHGSGKTTTARILSKAMICLQPLPDGQSCNHCSECLAVDLIETGQNISLNYYEMDAPSVGNVKNIRELIDDARLAPVGGSPHRVYLMDECHALTRDAQGVLLKALEDGVGRTIFILATTDPEKLLPTIKSRCIPVAITPADKPSVMAHLRYVIDQEGKIADDEALELIVDYNYGHLRDVLNMAYQISLAGPITASVVRKQLSLHLDEDAALLLGQAVDSWDQARKTIARLTQETSVGDLWGVLRRTLGEAYLCGIQPSRGVPEAVRRLADRYGARIGDLAEWALGDGARLQIRVVADLEIGLARIRERLGVGGGITPMRDRKIGPSKSDLRASGMTRNSPPLTDESLVDLFNLQAVANPSAKEVFDERKQLTERGGPG